MKKTRYTSADTIGVDARGWLEALSPYLRHRDAGSLDRAALIVLDLQRMFLDPASPAFLPAAPAILPGVCRLVEAFRKAGRPVVFTRHVDPCGAAGAAMEGFWGRRMLDGDPLTALDPAAPVQPGDPLVTKSSYSAFERTGLLERLAESGTDTVVLCGVQTPLCVETTARHAFVLGVRPVVAADATAAPDLDLHLGALRGLGHGVARVVLCDHLIASLGFEAAPATHARRDEREEADLLVVGAGPAGLAAATQALRAGLSVRVLDPERPGGLVRQALRVENYPGFPGGISGEDLANRIVAQAASVGVRVVPGAAERVGATGERLSVARSVGRIAQARAVIIATGTRPRRLGVPGEAEAAGRRVFYRVRDLLDAMRARTALVVGGGDCALDQALHLVQNGWEVRLLVRADRLNALPLLVRRASERGLPIETRTRVQALVAHDDSIEARIEGPAGAARVTADAVLVSVGREPCLPAIEGFDGVVAVDPIGRTDLRGVYLAGDCRRGLMRQVAIAAGDGVAAAMDAVRYLQTGVWI